MSKQLRNRVSRVGIATALFLVVSFSSPPTLPSVPDVGSDGPTLEEIYVLEELAEWVAGPSDLLDAVQSRKRSFELFRHFAGASARQDLVQGLPYGELIDSAAQRFKVDGLLLASIMEAESGFNPYAISSQGALGLMQVMPANAPAYPLEDLLEPEVNIALGAKYLVNLLDQFEGDVTLALASYNAGPTIVKQYGGLPPYSETHRYVDRVLTRYVRLQRRLWESSGASDLLF
jgi:soluble lytic murein transglycosylase-like protein